jgi:hypothetical protein
MSDPCPRCGEFMWSSEPHQCPPIHEVWSVEDERSEAYCCYARYPEAAVTKWAEQLDGQGDYTIANGCEEEVFVSLAGSTEQLRFRVRGEQVTRYVVTMVEEG